MQAVVCAENQTDYPQAPVTFAGSAEISTGPEPARPTAPADFRKLEENSIASSQIAYTAEQQYFSTEQEVSKQKQGFRLAKPKSLPDEVFGIHITFSSGASQLLMSPRDEVIKAELSFGPDL